MRINHYTGFFHGFRGKPMTSDKSEAYRMGYECGREHVNAEEMFTKEGVSVEYLHWIEAAQKLGLE